MSRIVSVQSDQLPDEDLLEHFTIGDRLTQLKEVLSKLGPLLQLADNEEGNRVRNPKGCIAPETHWISSVNVFKNGMLFMCYISQIIQGLKLVQDWLNKSQEDKKVDGRMRANDMKTRKVSSQSAMSNRLRRLLVLLSNQITIDQQLKNIIKCLDICQANAMEYLNLNEIEDLRKIVSASVSFPNEARSIESWRRVFVHRIQLVAEAALKKANVYSDSTEDENSDYKITISSMSFVIDIILSPSNEIQTINFEDVASIQMPHFTEWATTILRLGDFNTFKHLLSVIDYFRFQPLLDLATLSAFLKNDQSIDEKNSLECTITNPIQDLSWQPKHGISQFIEEKLVEFHSVLSSIENKMSEIACLDYKNGKTPGEQLWTEHGILIPAPFGFAFLIYINPVHAYAAVSFATSNDKFQEYTKTGCSCFLKRTPSNRIYSASRDYYHLLDQAVSNRKHTSKEYATSNFTKETGALYPLPNEQVSRFDNDKLHHPDRSIAEIESIPKSDELLLSSQQNTKLISNPHSHCSFRPSYFGSSQILNDPEKMKVLDAFCHLNNFHWLDLHGFSKEMRPKELYEDDIVHHLPIRYSVKIIPRIVAWNELPMEPKLPSPHNICESTPGPQDLSTSDKWMHPATRILELGPDQMDIAHNAIYSNQLEHVPNAFFDTKEDISLMETNFFLNPYSQPMNVDEWVKSLTDRVCIRNFCVISSKIVVYIPLLWKMLKLSNMDHLLKPTIGCSLQTCFGKKYPTGNPLRTRNQRLNIWIPHTEPNFTIIQAVPLFNKNLKDLLSLLRQQIVFNQLLLSCFNNGIQRVDDQDGANDDDPLHIATYYDAAMDIFNRKNKGSVKRHDRHGNELPVNPTIIANVEITPLDPPAFGWGVAIAMVQRIFTVEIYIGPHGIIIVDINNKAQTGCIPFLRWFQSALNATHDIPQSCLRWLAQIINTQN